MKTASRLVGTAAFREGRYGQDSPLYGAERRGVLCQLHARIRQQRLHHSARCVFAVLGRLLSSTVATCRRCPFGSLLLTRPLEV
jgi:hypothetical protein